MLTEVEINNNYNTFLTIIHDTCGDRSDKLINMYTSEFEFSLKYSPASSTEHFHNAFAGGYIDHVIRVLNFSFSVYENWKTLGIDVSTFSVEELAFSALHHDLGKLGFPGDGYNKYIVNQSEWHRKNQGKMYNVNPIIPFSLIQHQSLFILQKYNIQVSWNEYLGIMTHDGLYDEVNRPYYLASSPESRMRTNLPKILHQADLMASQFEYERWATANKDYLINYRG